MNYISVSLTFKKWRVKNRAQIKNTYLKEVRERRLN
jgi:hypothetical protein